MKKALIAVFVILIVALAWGLKVELGASPHLSRRFWLGYRRPEISVQNFIKGVNGDLIPQTKVGVGKGLVAYAPVLLTGLSDKSNFPDEMALVTYESSAAYEKLKKSAGGAAYQEVHWKYFVPVTTDGVKSISAVATPYDGQIIFGNAYFMPPGLNDLQGGTLTFTVLARNVQESDLDFLGRVKNYVDKTLENFCPKGLVDYSFRVEKNFVFEFQIWDSQDDWRGVRDLVSSWQRENFEVISSGIAEKSLFKSADLKPGQGLDIQFQP